MKRTHKLARSIAVASTSLVVAALVSAGIASTGSGPVQARVAMESADTVVELTGPINSHTDADGDKEYSIKVDGTVIQLDAGPHWFHGDNYPLAPYVGKTATVTGEQGSGPKPKRARSAEKDKGSEVDVLSVTIDGKTTEIRSAGKPAWAGGPKAVGKQHPGYEGWSRGQGNRSDK